jgi:hypothetical protein
MNVGQTDKPSCERCGSVRWRVLKQFSYKSECECVLFLCGMCYRNFVEIAKDGIEKIKFTSLAKEKYLFVE